MLYRRNTDIKLQRLYVAIFVLSLVLSVAYLFVGVGCQRDQFYWISLFDSYSTMPMVSLTLWLGKIWGRVFSLSILSMRLFAWLIEMASFLMAFMLIPRSHRKESIFLIAVSILLMGYGWQKEYSPTVITNFMIVASILCLLRYQKSRTPLKSVCILSVVTGLAISARFPNVVFLIIIPVALLCLDLNCRRNRYDRLKNIFIYVAASVAVYWLVMSVLTHSLFSFSDICSSFSSTSHGTHSVDALYKQYLWDFSSFFSFVAAAVFFLLPLFLYNNSEVGNGWKIVISILSASLFILFFVKSIGFHKWNNTMLLYFLSASVVACSLFSLYNSIRLRVWNDVVILSFIIIMSFVSTLGSDTRYLKLFPVTLFFLPYIWQKAFHGNNGVSKFIPIPLILCLFAILCYAGNPVCDFGSEPFRECKYHVDNPVFDGILMTDDDVEAVSNIENDVKSYPGPKKIYGNLAHFVSVISCGEIELGNSGFNFNFDDISKAPLDAETTLFICNEHSDDVKSGLVYLNEMGYNVVAENSMYYILKYNVDR